MQHDDPPATLSALGWRSFFADQADGAAPVRVTQIHRTTLHVMGERIDRQVPAIAGVAVGDWLLLDATGTAVDRVLERQSVISRRAPGPEREAQLIAANIDTAFVVTSCNADFNVARLERYLALALEAGMDPVIVLTKPDLAGDAGDYAAQAAAISERVPVVTVDAKGGDVTGALAPWCAPGRTIAFLGSSGVGKSTLTNALAGGDAIETGAIRESDARGRHTTTRRELHLLPAGFCVIDTPGMRELQMTDAAGGIAELFPDIHSLVGQCRFNDCSHAHEPGCALRAAVAAGTLDADRVARWQKLAEEDDRNSEALSARRAGDRRFGRVTKAKRNRK